MAAPLLALEKLAKILFDNTCRKTHVQEVNQFKNNHYFVELNIAIEIIYIKMPTCYRRSEGIDLDEFKKIDCKKPPENCAEMMRRIIECGSFAKALNVLMNSFLATPSEKSVIIVGDPASGRRTLVRLAQAKMNLITIYISPYAFTTDFSAIEFILEKIGLKLGDTLSDMMNAIERREHICLTEKVVVVLEHFEQFCTSKQSLLYNLTQMMQFGLNICLIGITSSRDCTANLEKRVRSRLSASFYTLEFPYSNIDEYIEFASLLVGGYEFSEELENEFRNIYITESRSIAQLKKHLFNICKWDKGKLNVIEPSERQAKLSNNRLLENRFTWLTLPQIEILIMITKYCKANNSPRFQLGQLKEWLKNHDIEFHTNNPDTIINVARLVSAGLIVHRKAQEVSIDEFSKLSSIVTQDQLKAVLEDKPEMKNIHINSTWMRLR